MKVLQRAISVMHMVIGKEVGAATPTLWQQRTWCWCECRQSSWCTRLEWRWICAVSFERLAPRMQDFSFFLHHLHTPASSQRPAVPTPPDLHTPAASQRPAVPTPPPHTGIESDSEACSSYTTWPPHTGIESDSEACSWTSTATPSSTSLSKFLMMKFLITLWLKETGMPHNTFGIFINYGLFYGLPVQLSSANSFAPTAKKWICLVDCIKAYWGEYIENLPHTQQSWQQHCVQVSSVCVYSSFFLLSLMLQTAIMLFDKLSQP